MWSVYIGNLKRNQPVTINVSKLALIAIVLAFLGLVLLILYWFIIRNPELRRNIPEVVLLYYTSLFVLGGAAIVGLVSLIAIELSGGKTTGRKLANWAILIPIFSVILFYWLVSLSRPRSVAFRMICGMNLSAIGKAMLIYANDEHDELPRAGPRGSVQWGRTALWDAATRRDAFGVDPSTETDSEATISASLYLLIKYGDIEPKRFICNEDRKVSEFDPAKYNKHNADLIDFWDFGPQPWKHISYSYHMPYGQYLLTVTGDPNMVIAADRNPFITSVGWKVKDFSAFDPNGGRNFIKNGNTPCHQDEGQNVLFLDGSVAFERVSFCGVNEDNIYTSWDGDDIRKGKVPDYSSQPAGELDSLLVNDPVMR